MIAGIWGDVVAAVCCCRSRSLTFWLQTSDRKVYRGHSRRLGGQAWASEVCAGRCGCCTLLLHHGRATGCGENVVLEAAGCDGTSAC